MSFGREPRKYWVSFAIYKHKRVEFGNYEGGAAKDRAYADVRYEKAEYKKDPAAWIEKHFPGLGSEPKTASSDQEKALLDYDESKGYDISDSLDYGDLKKIEKLLQKHKSYVPKTLTRAFSDMGPGDSIKRLKKDKENLKQDLESALSEFRSNLRKKYDLDED